MATLQLICDGRGYDMWSWSMGNTHQTARTMRRIRNNVYIAHIGPRGAQPTQIIIAKMARGTQEMHVLNREVEFYTNELEPLQGVVVPRFLGYFRSKAEGVDIGCLLLEYCSGYVGNTDIERAEQSRAMMSAAHRIHQVGIIHGNLGDGHHFVKMGDDVRIVDFSLAIRHTCNHGIPIPVSSRSPNISCMAQCPEVALVEKTYRVRNSHMAEKYCYNYNY